MIHTIHAKNVNQAYEDAMWYLRAAGRDAESRNGPVRVAPGPVITVYQRPWERVLFNPHRDANPFFHLMEALWMLAGRNDLAFVEQYVGRMREFSDDGKTLHGAYGHRWREHFGYDQLQLIIDELKGNPSSRRCVLAMWDAWAEEGGGRELCADLIVGTHGGKDVPCNTHVYFQVIDGCLEMTVCCRSNDAVWGCYGANAVHFSILQEYLAGAIGVPMGQYIQFSNNFHVYTKVLDLQDVKQFTAHDRYGARSEEENLAMPMLLFDTHDREEFDIDLENFFAGASDFVSPFFNEVANPMRYAHALYKKSGTAEALAYLEEFKYADTNDWLLAAQAWLQRRAMRGEQNRDVR